MTSKKGIGVTVAILVGVVAASFLVYLIPENTEMKFVVSDFEKNLDDIDALDEIALGRVWTGDKAKIHGLVDVNGIK